MIERQDVPCFSFLSSLNVYRQKQRNVFFRCPGLKGLDIPENVAFFVGKLERKAWRIVSFRCETTRETTRCTMLFFQVLSFTDKKRDVFRCVKTIKAFNTRHFEMDKSMIQSSR